MRSMQAVAEFGHAAAADRNSGARHTARIARTADARPSRPASCIAGRIAAGRTAVLQRSSCNCAANVSGENG